MSGDIVITVEVRASAGDRGAASTRSIEVTLPVVHDPDLSAQAAHAIVGMVGGSLASKAFEDILPHAG